MNKKLTLGFLPAHRGFFDAGLARAARNEIIRVAQGLNIDLLVPKGDRFAHGCVGTLEEAAACAELFAQARVEGVLVSAVNFGDEQSVAHALRGLNMPVLLHGCQEEGALTKGSKRRDSFCGLLSIADALRQCGIRYSVPSVPVSHPQSAEFSRDLQTFANVCRVVANMRRARYGQAGVRPDGFWTCRFDERALQRLGPTTVTRDLSDILARCATVSADAVSAVEFGAAVAGIPEEAKQKLARLEVTLKEWIAEARLDALAIQCWTSMECNFGICSCLPMSRLSDLGLPAACEADVLGAMSMHALAMATQQPTALADWNNLHHQDPDLVNLWHCGVYPASMASNTPVAGVHSILPPAGACTEDQAYGVLNLKVRPSEATLCRIAQDENGTWRALLVEGHFEEDPAETEGGFGWFRIPHLRRLYRDTLLRHFPHHVAFTLAPAADVLTEALGNYFGMTIHRHEG